VKAASISGRTVGGAPRSPCTRAVSASDPLSTARTRKEVADKLTKALTDRDSGLSFDAENLKLGD
jgi:hypothetical protein